MDQRIVAEGGLYRRAVDVRERLPFSQIKNDLRAAKITRN
jgi:hypothetical protein